jgi:hypothetical protein
MSGSRWWYLAADKSFTEITEIFCVQRDLFCSTLLLLQYWRMGGGQIITNTPEGKGSKTTNILSRLAEKAYLLGF